jgi:DNA-directed RNA polymerase subunit RPC12/RpoP
MAVYTCATCQGPVELQSTDQGPMYYRACDHKNDGILVDIAVTMHGISVVANDPPVNQTTG